MNEEQQKLYDVLVRDGYYTKSFEEFQTQFQDSAYQDKVFGVVERDGLFTKGKDSFLEKYAVAEKKKDDTEFVSEVGSSELPAVEGDGLMARHDSLEQTYMDAWKRMQDIQALDEPTNQQIQELQELNTTFTTALNEYNQVADQIRSEAPKSQDPAERVRSLRRGVSRKNEDGGRSTVKMADMEVDGKFVAVPTLFPKDPNNYGPNPEDWVEFGEDDAMGAYEMALERGEVFEFDTPEGAREFAKGSWKEMEEEPPKDEFNKSLEFVNNRLIDRSDAGQVARELEYEFGEFGFNFDRGFEAGIGNYITVTAANGETIDVNTNPQFLTDEDTQADLLRDFLVKNRGTTPKREVEQSIDLGQKELDRLKGVYEQTHGDYERAAAKVEEYRQKVQADESVYDEAEAKRLVEAVNAAAQADQKAVDEYNAVLNIQNAEIDELNRIAQEKRDEPDAFERAFGKNAVTDLIADNTYRPIIQGQAQAGTIRSSYDLLTNANDVTDEDIADFLRAQEVLEEYGPSDEMRDFQRIYQEEGGGWGGFVSAFGKRPPPLGELFVSSVSMMANKEVAKGALLAGAAAAPAGLAGGPLSAVSVPAAFLTGAMGGAGATLEAGISFAEFLRDEMAEKQGVDPEKVVMNNENIREVLSDPEAMSRIRYRAGGRGIAIGVTSLIGTGVAAAATRRTAIKTGSKLKAAATGAAVELPFEGLGETAGQLVAGQELDAAEIGLEALAGGPAQVVGVGIGLFKTPEYTLNGELVTGKQMADFIREADEADVAGATIEIKNDDTLAKQAHTKRDDARERVVIKEQLRKSGVENEETVDKLADLELEKRKLKGLETTAAERKKTRIQNEIDAILDGDSYFFEETTDEQGNKRSKEVRVTRRDAILALLEDDIVNPTEKEIEAKQAELFRDALADIQESDAVQESSTEEVDVGEQAADGEEVGVGDTEEQAVAEEEEEVVDEEAEELEAAFEAESTPDVEEDIDGVTVRRREGYEFGRKAQRVLDQAKKRVKALENFGVKIVLHENDAQFGAATNSTGRGLYDSGTKTIHINLDKANSRTVAHEAFHALFLERVKGDDAKAQQWAKATMKSVRKALDADSVLATRIDDFLARYEENVIDEEALAEIFGYLSEGYGELTGPQQSRVKAAIKKLIELFGLKLESQWSQDDQNVIDVLNTLAGKMERGETITEEELAGLDVSEEKAKEVAEETTVDNRVSSLQEKRAAAERKNTTETNLSKLDDAIGRTGDSAAQRVYNKLFKSVRTGKLRSLEKQMREASKSKKMSAEDKEARIDKLEQQYNNELERLAKAREDVKARVEQELKRLEPKIEQAVVKERLAEIREEQKAITEKLAKDKKEAKKVYEGEELKEYLAGLKEEAEAKRAALRDEIAELRGEKKKVEDAAPVEEAPVEEVAVEEEAAPVEEDERIAEEREAIQRLEKKLVQAKQDLKVLEEREAKERRGRRKSAIEKAKKAIADIEFDIQDRTELIKELERELEPTVGAIRTKVGVEAFGKLEAAVRDYLEYMDTLDPEQATRGQRATSTRRVNKVVKLATELGLTDAEQAVMQNSVQEKIEAEKRAAEAKETEAAERKAAAERAKQAAEEKETVEEKEAEPTVEPTPEAETTVDDAAKRAAVEGISVEEFTKREAAVEREAKLNIARSEQRKLDALKGKTDKRSVAERKNIKQFIEDLKTMSVEEARAKRQPSAREQRVAANEYDLKSLKKVGEGSTRVVYDLGDGRVLKRAKNPRGLMQNDAIMWADKNEILLELLPEVYFDEEGADYVIHEKVPRNDSAVRKFLKPLKDVYDENRIPGDRYIHPKVMRQMEEMGLGDFLNYDLLMGDFVRPSSWGQRENGDFVLIDDGTLSRAALEYKFGKLVPVPESYQESWAEVKKLKGQPSAREQRVDVDNIEQQLLDARIEQKRRGEEWMKESQKRERGEANNEAEYLSAFEEARKKVRFLEDVEKGRVRIDEEQREKVVDELSALSGDVRKGELIREDEDLSGIYEVEVDGMLFRGVSLEDFRRIQESGFINTDLRGVISEREGINLAQSPATAFYYLPLNGPGVVMAIDVSDKSGLFAIGADNYVRSSKPIPTSDIKFVTNPNIEGYFMPIVEGEVDNIEVVPFAPEQPFTAREQRTELSQSEIDERNAGVPESRNMPYKDAPSRMYHVTFAGKAIRKAGKLLASSGLGTGGIGGTESVGVSFYDNASDAEVLRNELDLISQANAIETEEEAQAFIDRLQESKGRSFQENYNLRRKVDDKVSDSLREVLRLERFRVNGPVIFREGTLPANQSVEIIEVSKEDIPESTRILRGVDKNEVRVLSNVTVREQRVADVVERYEFRPNGSLRESSLAGELRRNLKRYGFGVKQFGTRMDEFHIVNLATGRKVDPKKLIAKDRADERVELEQRAELRERDAKERMEREEVEEAKARELQEMRDQYVDFPEEMLSAPSRLSPRQQRESLQDNAGKFNDTALVKFAKERGYSDAAILKVRPTAQAAIDAYDAQATRLSREVQGIIEKARARARGDKKIQAIDNKGLRTKAINDRIIKDVKEYIKGSKMYEEASDVGREAMLRAVDKQMGRRVKAAPSVLKILDLTPDKGVLIDKKNLIEQIRAMARSSKATAAASREIMREVGKDIARLKATGTISSKQATAILRKMANMDPFNPVQVENFVNYTARVFAEAEYIEEVNKLNKLRKRALKNASKKLGISTDLMPMLQTLLNIDARLVPENVFEKYKELVNDLGERKTVLNLKERTQMFDDVVSIMSGINEELAKKEELFARYEAYTSKADSVKGKIADMVKDEVVTEEEADILNKYADELREERKMSEEEKEKAREEERAKLVDAIQRLPKLDRKFPTQMENKLVRRFNKLVRTEGLLGLSNADLKNVLRVADNIQNGFLPHTAQVLVEQVEVNNRAVVVEQAIKEAKLPNIARIRALLGGVTNNTAIARVVNRNPLRFIDQVYGDYRTTRIYDAAFKDLASSYASYKSDVMGVQQRLDRVEEKLIKSLGRNPNAVIRSKFLIGAYMMQAEFDTNPDVSGVFDAVSLLDETIKKSDRSRGSAYYSPATANVLRDIRKNIDGKSAEEIRALLSEEERAVADEIRSVNDELTPKAEYVAGVLRGVPFRPFSQYFHRIVLTQDDKAGLRGVDALIDEAKTRMRKPSTKAQNIQQRITTSPPAVNFDPFASARRGARYILTDYHMTEAVRTNARLMNKLEATDMTSKQRQFYNAIDNASEATIADALVQSYTISTIGEQAVEMLKRQGYRVVLADMPRMVGELLSNILFVSAAAGRQFAAGIGKHYNTMATNGADVMKNVGSVQTTRLYADSKTISSRMVESIRATTGPEKNDVGQAVFNRAKQIWAYSGAPWGGAVNSLADFMITTPDKIVTRPVWFGTFAEEFKARSGKEVDFDKIAANDEAYMAANEEAIKAATDAADLASVQTGATDNPFLGIVNSFRKSGGTAAGTLIKAINSYMTRFLVFEFVTARTAINASVGNGTITKLQGVKLLSAVLMRMVAYVFITNALRDMLDKALNIDEPEDDDKTLEEEFDEAVFQGIVSLVVGGTYGSVLRGVASTGIEFGRKELMEDAGLDFEYDDSVFIPLISPAQDGRPYKKMTDLLARLSGPYNPIVRPAILAGKLAFDSDKKEVEAIKRRDEEFYRLGLEVLGLMGMVPLYKDVRRLFVKEIYKDLDKDDTPENIEKRIEEELKKLRKEARAK